MIAYVPDLMDRSRLGALQLEFVSTPDALEAAGPGHTVLVDLGRTGALDAAGAASARGARVIGFASHVDDALLDAAKAAGIEALPRSRFFASVADLVS